MANAALTAMLAAAAHQEARTERALIGQLRTAGALSPRRAAPLDLSAKGSDRLLGVLLKRNYVRNAGGGGYWLDEEELAAFKAQLRKASLVVAAALVSVGASLVALAATL